jgi:hypothetical protein
LPAGTSAELLIQPLAGKPADPDHAEPATLVGISTEADIGAAAGHLGGHGDHRGPARPGDQGGFLGGVLRVQHHGG